MHRTRLAPFTRRTFLKVLGVGGFAAAFQDFLPLLKRPLVAANGDPLYLIFCTFEGGWDQLLALDPRDNTVYNSAEGAIFPAYDLSADNDDALATLLSSNPSGIVRPVGSNLSFGPAVGRLAEGDLFQDLCIVRGVNMGTLTHEVGRRYLLTGKFPSGLQASGSSLATVVANSTGDNSVIPNLVMGMETYNDGLGSFASGLVVQSAEDIQLVLTPIGDPLSSTVNTAINGYLNPSSPQCGDELLDGNGQISQYLTARTKAQQMVAASLGSYFAFSSNPSDPNLQALNVAFHISSNTQEANQQLAGAAGEAMIAAQAISLGISQAVSIRLATNIDHHDDTYLTDHSLALRTGFDALADLITYLRSVIHPTSGKSYWDHCVLLCGSDFARTPALNNRDGRDHHLASSCLVAGRGIRGNQIIGSTDENLNSVGIDLSTGAAVGANGWTLRPPDIHATLLEAAGLSWDHLANQDPQLVTAMIES